MVFFLTFVQHPLNTSIYKKMEVAHISEIQLYNALKQKLGETETGQLLTFMKNEIKDNVLSKTDHLATKADLEKTQGKLLLWSFVFWVTQLAVIGGFLKFLYNALLAQRFSV